MVDVENEYFKKDGIMEDAVKEMTITVGGEDEGSDEEEVEEDMMDEDDRQVIGRAPQQSEHSTSIGEQSTQKN